MFYNPDITVAFSGYNIKNMALLSIDSLLKIYPQMRSQIVYFDDFSPDGTKKELRSRGIRVIGWDKALLNQYNDIVSVDPGWGIVQKLSTRVSFIIENIIRQTKTDYLLLNDGDVIFLREGILEDFESLATEGFDVVYEKQNTFNDKGPSVRRVVDYINAKYGAKVNENSELYRYWRMAHSHIFLNVKKLKEKGITSDTLSFDTLKYMEGGIYDTFVDFSNRIADSGCFKIKEIQIFGKNVLHFGGHACVQRGFPLGVVCMPNPNGKGNIIQSHLYWPNMGMPVERDFVIIDLCKGFEEIKREFGEIDHILNNGYVVENIFFNKTGNIYKILFKKIQYPSNRAAFIS